MLLVKSVFFVQRSVLPAVTPDSCVSRTRPSRSTNTFGLTFEDALERTDGRAHEAMIQRENSLFRYFAARTPSVRDAP
jgi:hypothetical protein